VGEPALDAALLGADDRHILLRLNAAIEDCTANLEKYRFNDAALALYEFVWHQYCDWYLEYAKEVLNGEDAGRRAQTLRILHTCLSAALRLLHPMMPFVTEELWQAMGYAEAGATIMKAPWPVPLATASLAQAGVRLEDSVYVEAKHELVRLGRQLRADYGIAPARRLDYLIRPDSFDAASRLEADIPSLRAALRAETVTVDAGLDPETAMPGMLTPLGMLYLPLDGVIDVGAERERLTAELEKVNGHLAGALRKLENESFVGKAPDAVVAQVRATRDELREKQAKLQAQIASLG